LNATSAELAAAGESGRQFGVLLSASMTPLIFVVSTLASTFLTVGTAIRQAVAIGVGYFSQLMAAGQSLVSGFATIGSQIMDGLLGGLTAGFAKVKAQVSSMASSIKSSFQGVLGIHSPSRVFAELGGFINQGLQIGLAQSSGDPIGESVKIAQGVTKAFDAGMDLTGAAARPPASSQGAEGAASPPAMSISITINQLPGENSEDLANRIIAKIEQRQQLSKRGKLHD
jgi:hypothetical protein